MPRKGERKGIAGRQRLNLVRGEQADPVASVLKLRMKTVFSRFATNGTSKKRDIFIYKVKIYLDRGFVPS
jgi:hypothetical protein